MNKLPQPPMLKREQGFNDVMTSIDYYYTEYVVKHKKFPDDFQETLKLLESDILSLPITNIPSIESKNRDVKAKLNLLRKSLSA